MLSHFNFFPPKVNVAFKNDILYHKENFPFNIRGNYFYNIGSIVNWQYHRQIWKKIMDVFVPLPPIAFKLNTSLWKFHKYYNYKGQLKILLHIKCKTSFDICLMVISKFSLNWFLNENLKRTSWSFLYYTKICPALTVATYYKWF